MSNVLIVAPHPDDETLGCGGTILKHTANKDKVSWLIMTQLSVDQGYKAADIKERDEDITKVAKQYGFTRVFKGKFNTTCLDQYPKNKLIEFVANAIKSVKPNIVYLPFKFDIHSDHSVCHDTVISCTKSFRYPFIKKIICYETVSETEFSLNQTNTFKPNLFVDISRYLNKKIQIMKIYGKEMGKHPFPRSEENIRSLATFRGATANVNAAESFMILKEIS